MTDLQSLIFLSLLCGSVGALVAQPYDFRRWTLRNSATGAAVGVAIPVVVFLLFSLAKAIPV